VLPTAVTLREGGKTSNDKFKEAAICLDDGRVLLLPKLISSLKKEDPGVKQRQQKRKQQVSTRNYLKTQLFVLCLDFFHLQVLQDVMV